jgi:hypothetical protein
VLRRWQRKVRCLVPNVYCLRLHMFLQTVVTIQPKMLT